MDCIYSAPGISVDCVVTTASPFALSPVVVVVVHFGAVAVTESALETTTATLSDEEDNKRGNSEATGGSCTNADSGFGSCG